MESGIDEKIKLDIGEKLRNILNMDYQNLIFYFKRHENSLKVDFIFKLPGIYLFVYGYCQSLKSKKFRN